MWIGFVVALNCLRKECMNEMRRDLALGYPRHVAYRRYAKTTYRLLYSTNEYKFEQPLLFGSNI